MEKKEDLENRYKKLSPEELMDIVYIKNREYTDEAITVASEELKKRGIAQKGIERSIPELQEERLKLKEEEKIANTYLSKRMRILCLIWPGIGFLYPVFAPEKWKHGKRDWFRWWLRGMAIYLFLMVLISIWWYVFGQK